MVSVPTGYPLEKSVNRKILKSRKYQAWTVEDLRNLIADLPDDTVLWIGRYDEAADDIYLRPIESLSAGPGHVIIGS